MKISYLNKHTQNSTVEQMLSSILGDGTQKDNEIVSLELKHMQGTALTGEDILSAATLCNELKTVIADGREKVRALRGLFNL